MIPSSKAPETSRVNAEELARFRAGDEAVLARLVKEHGPALRRIAFRYGRMSFDEADDAVQETISRAWNTEPRMRVWRPLQAGCEPSAVTFAMTCDDRESDASPRRVARARKYFLPRLIPVGPTLPVANGPRTARFSS